VGVATHLIAHWGVSGLGQNTETELLWLGFGTHCSKQWGGRGWGVAAVR
jgi:hypothetical protein